MGKPRIYTRAEAEALLQATTPGRLLWFVKTPTGEDDWFDDLAVAEEHAIEVMAEQLRAHGEGSEDGCYVLACVGETSEIVTAHRDDDSEDGEWLRSSGFDYKIGGYKFKASGLGALLVAAPDLVASVAHHAQRADAAEDELARLRDLVRAAFVEGLGQPPRARGDDVGAAWLASLAHAEATKPR